MRRFIVAGSNGETAPMRSRWGSFAGQKITRKHKMKYGISKRVPYSYEEAVERVTEELKKEGFGVLTTIDVKATLKQKLNVDFDKYVILGACNPPLAHQALQAEEEVGLLLPCNVIVYEKNAKTTVSVFAPMTITHLSDNEKLQKVAEDVDKKMRRVLEAL
jgi:uncharacterized protein (DUF302 family)